MKIETKRTATGLALLAHSLFFTPGCSRPHQPPVLAIIGIDVSGSASDQLIKNAALIYGYQRSLPDGSRLRVYVFGSGSCLTYAGSKITGKDEFNRRIGQGLLSPPRVLLGPGTQPDWLMESIASDSRSTAGSVHILIASDGGMESYSKNALSRLASSVAQLADSANVEALTIVGVRPEFRQRWEKWLAPMGKRASVKGVHDADIESHPSRKLGGSR